MCRFVLISIIALLAINLGLYAQEKDTAQGEPQIKLELVWEKEFEDPIADYIVGLDKKGNPVLDVVSFVTDEGKKSSVQFFNSAGEITKNIKGSAEHYGSRVLISKDRQYIGISSVVEGDPEFIYKVDFDVYDKTGNYIWGQKGMNARPFRFLSMGTMLSYEGFGWQKFTLHGKDGLIDSLSPIQAEGTGAVDVSVNNHIVFNVHDVNRKEGHLVLYDRTGKEIWLKKFSWQWTGKVNISDDGSYIAAIGESKELLLYVFSNNGNLLWTFPSGHCEFMDFSPEEKYFAASINRDAIYLFESSTGKIIWRYKLTETNGYRKFFSITVSKNGDFVAAADGGGRRELPADSTSMIFVFNKNGNVVWQTALVLQEYLAPNEYWAPNVRFTVDGRHLLICNYDKLYCYEILGGGR